MSPCPRAHWPIRAATAGSPRRPTRSITGATLCEDLLPRLAAAGLPPLACAGPRRRGWHGDRRARGAFGGGEPFARRRLRSVGHRTYIEYLLQSPNLALADALLPDLLTALRRVQRPVQRHEASCWHGTAAGDRGDGRNALKVNGALPWVTNLRPQVSTWRRRLDGPDGVPFVASFAGTDAVSPARTISNSSACAAPTPQRSRSPTCASRPTASSR